MKIKLVLSIFVLPLLAILFKGEQIYAGNTEPTYWISYQKESFSGGEKYLLRIDSFGNTILGPKRVISSGKIGNQGGATALSMTPKGNIILWIGAATHEDFPRGKIYKAIINSKDLSLISLRLTNQKTSDAFRLQVTQRLPNNFLAFRKKSASGEFLTAVELNAKWAVTGKQRIISQDLNTCEEFNPEWCPSAISADGTAAVYTKPGKSPVLTELLYQRLDIEGNQIGKSNLLATLSNPYPYGFNSGTIISLDITDILPNNRRLIAYGWAPKRLNDNLPDTLFVQIVQGVTGKPLGDRIKINRSDFLSLGPSQDVAIDPLGRFVLFSVNEQSAGAPPPNFNLLFLQALDALGHPSGQPKVLATHVHGEIDLLMQP